MQGKHDASEFGYYICDDPIESDLGDGATTQISEQTFCVTGGNEDGITHEYQAQIAKIQRERNQKYRHFGHLNVAATDTNGTNPDERCIIMSSDLTPKKIPYFPLMLTTKGITI